MTKKNYRRLHQIACDALSVAKERASELFDIPKGVILFRKIQKDGSLRVGYKNYESEEHFRMVRIKEIERIGIDIQSLPEYTEFSETRGHLISKVRNHFKEARDKSKMQFEKSKMEYLSPYYMERRKIYEDYMSSEEWQEKRRKCFLYHGNTCKDCKKKPATDIHHRHYDSLGDECHINDLVPLCSACHEYRHERNSLMHKPE